MQEAGGSPVAMPEGLRQYLREPLSADELGWLAQYRLLKLLGRGGMGVVFLAEDTHLQRKAALKVMLPEMAANPVSRDRFLREARAAAALRSDHVVTVYQVGQENDLPFLAMELLQGQSLDERLRGPRPGTAEAARIAREVVEGLAAAHAAGLVHRDVKPANIWLEQSEQLPAPGRAKLLDFGLARSNQPGGGLTQTGSVIGTPAYMSPEQARGMPLDARSDLFSLGVVLYEMCAGKLPFQGETLTAVLTALAVDTPAPVTDLNPDVPPALADLLGRLLEKKPDDRPGSAREVADALRAIETGSAVRDTQVRRATRTNLPLPAGAVPPRRLWQTAILAAGAVAAAVGLALAGLHLFGGENDGGEHGPPAGPSGPPIRIGVLHSHRGTMRLSERPVVDAVQLAVEEINHKGGLLGRPVEAVVADGQSDEEVFAREAERLITQEKVCAVFGCWTSASRKAVRPVVERLDHLLVYPVQYEGMEQSPNIVYLGPVPNQQIIPALQWLEGFQGKRRWFVVGSDYVFPRAAGEVIRDEAKRRRAEIVGEEYLPLGAVELRETVAAIAKARPDLIVNTINGDTNIAFFRELRRTKSGDRVPVISFSISEQERDSLGGAVTAGDYVAGSYFDNLDSAENQAFVKRFQERYGKDRDVSDPMQTAYVGVYLWAQAVRQAGTDEVKAVRAALKGQKFDAPQGPVRIDPATQHAWQVSRVGRMDEAGQVEEVFASPHPVVPEPYPSSRSREAWDRYLLGLHKKWGGRWSNSAP